MSAPDFSIEPARIIGAKKVEASGRVDFGGDASVQGSEIPASPAEGQGERQEPVSVMVDENGCLSRLGRIGQEVGRFRIPQPGSPLVTGPQHRGGRAQHLAPILSVDLQDGALKRNPWRKILKHKVAALPWL